MNYDFKQTFLSRCLLSGLLAGLIAVGANFIYNYIFREVTSYALSEVVNITSIMFSSLIVLVVAGVCYFLFSKMKYGTTIYVVVFLLLTLLGIYAAIETHRSPDPNVQQQFRELFGGIILINGCLAAFLVPYFTNHESIYS